MKNLFWRGSAKATLIVLLALLGMGSCSVVLMSSVQEDGALPIK